MSVENLVTAEVIDNQKRKAKEKEVGWKGMHNGAVAGKSFEKSRRTRKSHAARKANLSHGK